MLHWYDYPSLTGILLAVTLPALPRRYAPVVVAVILHLLCDYALQTEWMDSVKPTDRRALLLHSLVAGFLPLAGLGLAAGSPGLALVGGLIGFASHLAIDGSNKFGLPFWPGLPLDQAAHLVVIVAAFYIGGKQ